VDFVNSKGLVADQPLFFYLRSHLRKKIPRDAAVTRQFSADFLVAQPILEVYFDA
jgi:hypothetical protein